MTDARNVVVPIDPTPEMLGSWYRVKNGHHYHDEPPPTDTSDYAAYRAMLASAPAPSSLAGGDWRSPTEVPETKKGEHAYRIVAVKRADGEKVVSFSAFYMNAVPLWFEDDNESRNVTGWHSDSEGDDGPTYSPLLTEGDVLMGWREFPQWGAALSPEAPARVGVEADIRLVRSFLSDYAPRDVYAAWRRIEALTPRHEAPAEGAGEPFERYPALASWIARMASTGNGLSLGEWMTFVGSLNAAIVTAEGRARSSAPEAREGDQPFTYAYRYPDPMGGTVVRLDTNGREVNGSKPQEAIPLYTHPAAPSADKLRDVLVDLTSWFTKPVQGQSGMVWVIPAGERGADDALNAALAALKAEGA